MRKPIIVGNWKLNKTISEAVEFITAIEPLLHDDADFGVATSYLALQASVQNAKRLIIAAQNVNENDSGAFTGEVSASMLQDFACRYVLVGHSERRSIYGETDALVAEKFAVALAAGLRPVLCVGETLAERERGETAAVVAAQIDAVLGVAGIEAFAKAVVAYEPVWAIGTGKTASPADAQAMHAKIREGLSQITPAGQNMAILYGGSVKPENAVELAACPDINGALVGGASLNAASFHKIAQAFANTK